MKRSTEQTQFLCPWQECQDENSGYSYYWNMTTNEVTWEMPAEYQLALQKWQLLQQQQLAAPDKKAADTCTQLSASSVSQKLEAGKNKLSSNRRDSTSSKKKYPFDSDPEEDEKIELITSYGSESSDNSDSESSANSKSTNKKSCNDSSKSKFSAPRISKSSWKPDTKIKNTNVYGPYFPPNMPLDCCSVSKKTNISEGNEIKSVSLVPYGDASDVINLDESFTSNFNQNISVLDESSVENSKILLHDEKNKSGISGKKKKTSNEGGVGIDEEESEDAEEDEDEDFDEDESLILSKLRSQAMVLKQLGGEIPDEIKCLIDSENPDIGIDDIIALIENETPPDHSTKDSLSKEAVKSEEIKDVQLIVDKVGSPKQMPESSQQNNNNGVTKANQPSSFALIAGYGDDSDQDESNSPTKSSGVSVSKRKALFPIDEKQNNSCIASKSEFSTKPAFKKIKLSARAKALINASIITAKARATPSIYHSEENIGETKPGAVESLTSMSEDKSIELVSVKDPMTTHLECSDSVVTAKEEIKSVTSEKIQVAKKKKTQELREEESEKQKMLSVNGPSASEGTLKSKSSTLGSTCCLKSLAAGLESTAPQSGSYTTVWDTAVTYAADEKRGFGFSNDTSSSSSSSSSTPLAFHRSKSDKKATAILFVKAETINVNLPAPIIPSFAEIEKEEGVSKSEIEALSELIVEKVKYLSEGKEPVSPVQIMTIQIETLMSAWEGGCLKGKYLLDWLNATSKQLFSLEEEAAPHGWKCEWDRSFNRYYYRNIETGGIQWEYPVTQESEELLQEVEMELCETPPPPLSPISIPVPPPPNTPPPPHEPPLPKTPPPPVISFSPPPPPIISSCTLSNRRPPSKSKSKVSILSIALPPLPSSPPPSAKKPPPPPPPVTTLPPLPHARINVPLPPGSDPGSRGNKSQKTIKEFNMNNAQFFPAQEIPPPPPSCPPPLPPPQPLFAAVSEQDPFPLSQSSVPRRFQDQVPDKKSHQVISTPAYMSQPAQLPLPPTDTDLNSVLNSFYSDIASLEATVPEESSKSDSIPPLPDQSAPATPFEFEPTSIPKKKKKVKLAAGLTLKKKGLDSLVAKWEKVNKTVCD